MDLTEIALLLLCVLLILFLLIISAVILLMHVRIDDLESDMQLISERLVKAETLIETCQRGQ